MLLKAIIVLALVAGAFFLLKDRLPSGSPSSNSVGSEQKQQVKSMTFDEVLALGGTCFNSALVDETGNVEGFSNGPRFKAPEKKEFDTTRIALSRDGNSLMQWWEFAGTTDSWLTDHNIRLHTYHSVGKGDDDRFDVEKHAHDSHWTGKLVRGAESTSFDPKVRVHPNGVQFIIPWDLISTNNIVDILAFGSDFYHKPTSTMYDQQIWPPKNKRSTSGHFTSWFCSQQ